MPPIAEIFEPSNVLALSMFEYIKNDKSLDSPWKEKKNSEMRHG